MLHAPDKELFFSVRVKKKEVIAYIIIDKATCLPLWVSFQKFSFRDRWKLSNWQCVFMRYTKSGHYMVRPIIYGKEAGCFIIDIGIGCLAITKEKAMRLGMHGFGEVDATTTSGGPVMKKTQFFRGNI